MEQNIKVFYWDNKENIILLKLWKKVQLFLEKKGYKFTLYSEKNEPIWSDLMDNLNKGKYDIAVAPLFYMTQRIKKVDFTYPITTQKTNILYNAKINTENRLLFFLKSSLPVILLMITFLTFYSLITAWRWRPNAGLSGSTNTPTTPTIRTTPTPTPTPGTAHILRLLL